MEISNLDPTLGASLVNLAASLTSLVLKGTATAVYSKIESIKNEKNIDKIRNAYDEIVNQLLSEREEALRIAQIYKQELEKVVISDEDIDYLQHTITKILDILKAMQPIDNGKGDITNAYNIAAVEGMKNLISKDVLKTMQLLGFNYKAAIGEPLTELCANKICSWGKCNSKKNVK